MSKKTAATEVVNVTVETVKASAKAKAAPAKGAKAAAKEATPAVVKAPKVKEAKVKAPRAETKADKARALFTSMAGSARKDIVKAFQEQLSLSEAGAATYYQNIKAKAGTSGAAPVAAAKEDAAAE
jgi:hypothetical protein